MTFAAHFREHVTPLLADEADKQGKQLAFELTDWTIAESRVTATARRYGATNLPEETMTDLLDWIDTRILAAQVEQEALNANTQTELARLEADNPVAYYERLARGDNALRWTFAAICPTYRKWLNGCS